VNPAIEMQDPFPTDSQTAPHMPSQSFDTENQDKPQDNAKHSVYKGLGWLDRLLVLWILLAIVIGILLGNFVSSVGPALQKGKFVNVSVPIGMCDTYISHLC
jgi:arsenite transporter